MAIEKWKDDGSVANELSSYRFGAVVLKYYSGFDGMTMFLRENGSSGEAIWRRNVSVL